MSMRDMGSEMYMAFLKALNNASKGCFSDRIKKAMMMLVTSLLHRLNESSGLLDQATLISI